MATQALDAGAGKSRVKWIVGLIALSGRLNYVDPGALGVAAPLMKAELKLSATGFGLAVSAFFWVYAPACLLVGWLLSLIHICVTTAIFFVRAYGG